MTYIITQLFKKQVPYCCKHVCCIKNLLPSNKYMKETYNLIDEDRIMVKHTKRSHSPFHIKGYRTAFKHIFTGTVAEFEIFCRKYYEKNVWKNIKKDKSA